MPLRGIGTLTESSVGVATIPVNAAPDRQVGDWMFAVIGAPANPPTHDIDPGTWTEIAGTVQSSTTTGTLAHPYIFMKKVETADLSITTYNFSVTGSNPSRTYAAKMYAYYDLDPTNPIDDLQQSTDATATDLVYPLPAVTTEGADRIIVRLPMAREPTTYPQLSGYTEHDEVTGSHHCWSWQTAIQAAAGSSGALNITAEAGSTLGEYVGTTIALIPASAGPSAPTEDLVPSGAPTTQTGLTGAYTAIDDPTDPALDDGDWMTGTNPSGTAGTTQDHPAQDPNTPSLAVTGFTATTLTNEANVFDTSDTTFAGHSPGTNSVDYGRYFQFPAADFSGIPSDATINSIAVRVRARAGTNNRLSLWMQAMASNGGTVIGSEGQADGGTPISTTVADYGANTVPAMNAVPTRAQLVSGTFGIRLRWRRSNTVALELYRIQVTVNYTTAATPGTTQATEVIVPLSDPSTITPDAAAQGTLKMLVRKLGNGVTGGNPTVIGELREGTTVRGSISSQTVSGEHEFTALVNQNTITDWTNLNFRMRSDGVSGALVELGAARYVATGEEGPTTTRVQKDLDLRWAVAAPAVTPTVTSRRSGAVLPDGFKIAGQFSGATTVALRVSTNSDLSSPVGDFSASAPDAQGYTKATATGLSANTLYYWGWVLDGSLVAGGRGQTRTLVANGTASSFGVAMASCVDHNDNTEANSAIFTQIENKAPKMMFHMGDKTYADVLSTNAADHRAPQESQIAQSLQQSLYSKIPEGYIYSDHDFCGNNSSSISTGAAVAPVVNRQLFPRYSEAADYDTGGTRSDACLDYAVQIGRVHFFHMDTRTESTDRQATDNTSKTKLGASQKTRLKNWLSHASRKNLPKVIFTQEPWHSSESTGDGWGRYTTERTELTDYITANGVTNVVFVGGDAHMLGYQRTGTPGGWPVYQAAPLGQDASLKGGPWEATYPASPDTAGPTKQCGWMEFTDTGGNDITMVFSGFDQTGATVLTAPTHTFTNVVSTTRVQKDLDLRWKVSARISQSIDLRWRVLSRISQSIDLRWRVLSRLSQSIDLRWRVASRVNSSVDLRWVVASRISQSTDLRWRVLSRLSKDIDLRWKVNATKVTDVRLTMEDPPEDLVAGADLQSFVIEARKQGTGPNPTLTAYLYENGTQRAELLTDVAIPDASEVFTAPWNASLLSDITGSGVELRVLIEGFTDGYGELVDVQWNATHIPTPTSRVQKDLDLRWQTSGRISSDVDLVWRVLSRLSQSIDLRWRVASRVSKDIDLRWRVSARITQSLDLRWRVAERVSSSVDLRWAVLAVTTSRVQKDLDLRWKVTERVSQSIDLRWRVLNRISTSLDLRWRVLSRLSQSLDLRWRVAQRVQKDADFRWRVAARVVGDVDLRWKVEPVPGRVVKDLDLRWKVSSRVSSSVDLRWKVYTRLSQSLDLRWKVLSRVSQSIDLRWRVAQRTQKDLELVWKVAGVTLTRIQKDLDLRWKVSARITKDLDLRWTVASFVFVIKADGYVKPKIQASGEVRRKIHATWLVSPKIKAEGQVRPKTYAEGQVREP